MAAWLRSSIWIALGLAVVIMISTSALLEATERPSESLVKGPPSHPTLAVRNSWPKPEGWQPAPSHRQDRGIVKVVWLEGTPYEMGYQHGQLLHDEIASLGPEIIRGLQFFGRGLGLGRLAMHRSFPDVIEECQGLSDATADIGMTLDACMVLAFGDVYQEFFTYSLPNILFNDGCSNFIAAGAATRDGRLYHGRSLENNGSPVDYWLKNPTLFIRQPNDGIPHLFIAVPGAVWPNSGLNAAGLSISLNTAHPRTLDELSLQGGSNVQMMAHIMKHATTYDQASALMTEQLRMRANLILIADGKSGQAGVFELTGRETGIRELDERGVLYMTNHFVSEKMEGKDEYPPDPSSPLRYDRFAQLLEPDGIHTRHGELTPTTMVEILRDRTNPYTFEESDIDIYDDDSSIATNGSMRMVVLDPEKLLVWIATGAVPVPQNPFVCFSLGKMLNFPDAEPCRPPLIP